MNSNNYIKKYNVPNLISVSRLIISVYFFFYIDYSNIYYLNLILYISLIGISDAIDGYLARKYDAITRLGTIIDPFVDRTVFILLLFWLKPLFTDIFFWGILIRDGLVLLGSLLILNRTKTIQVSNLGKFTTVLLFITICIHVLNLNIGIDNIVIFMSYTSLFLYYYVALEYLYKQVLFSK